MSQSQVRTLTKQHRKQQLALRAATLRDVVRLWPAFDINNVERSWQAIEEALFLLTQVRGGISSGLASNYYRRAREAVDAPGVALPQEIEINPDKVVTGLRIVGPFNALKQLSLGRPGEDVAKKTLVNVSGEVTRHVLNAGRQTVDLSVKFDEEAIGWRRVTSASPCSFCSMLAGRGPVYKAETADFSAHRHCACFPEPAFR